MKLYKLVPAFAIATFLALLASAAALDVPRIIPHSGHVNRPTDIVFEALKGYFSDVGASKFNLVSADKARGTIVAKQSGIDAERWRNWAACQTDPLHMLYAFNDGAVTVTIKVDREARDASYVTVSADFEGTYVLAQDSITVPCTSTGALEDNILALAGVQPAAAAR